MSIASTKTPSTPDDVLTERLEIAWEGRLRPKTGEREKKESDHSGLDRHLIFTEQCP